MQLPPVQHELDKIEQALDNGTLESVGVTKLENKRLQQIAKNTLNKTKNINIRLSECDIHYLKTKAVEDGIPY